MLPTPVVIRDQWPLWLFSTPMLTEFLLWLAVPLNMQLGRCFGAAALRSAFQPAVASLGVV
jgi:hypothetical protein